MLPKLPANDAAMQPQATFSVMGLVLRHAVTSGVRWVMAASVTSAASPCWMTGRVGQATAVVAPVWSMWAYQAVWSGVRTMPLFAQMLRWAAR